MKNKKALGWLVAAGMLSAALVAPSTASAVGINDECGEGYSYYFKIDDIGDSGIVGGTYDSSDTNVETNWSGQEITISDVTNGGQDFAWASTKTVLVVKVKEGNTLVSIAAGGMSGSVESTIEQGGGLSHVTFCGNDETTTTTSTSTIDTTTSTSTIDTVTTTSTIDTTTSTSTIDTVTTTSTDETSTTDTSTIDTVTTEEPTPPSTDSISAPQASGSNALQFVLLAAGGLLAAVLLLTPSVARRKR